MANYQINSAENDLLIKKIVSQEAISLVKEDKNRPDEMVFYDIQNMVKNKVIVDKHDGEIELQTEKLTGDGIPSVSTTGTTNANVLKPVNTVNDVSVFTIHHELELDINKMSDGRINKEKSLRKAINLLNAVKWYMLMTGKAQDANTGKAINMISNSLLGISSKTQGIAVNNLTTANQWNSYIAQKFEDYYEATGYEPDTMPISSKVLRKVATLEAEKGEDFISFNKKHLGLKIFTTQTLNNTDDGACLSMFNSSDNNIAFVDGKLTNIRDSFKNNHYELPLVQAGIGGYVDISTNSNAVITETDLLRTS